MNGRRGLRVGLVFPIIIHLLPLRWGGQDLLRSSFAITCFGCIGRLLSFLSAGRECYSKKARFNSIMIKDLKDFHCSKTLRTRTRCIHQTSKSLLLTRAHTDHTYKHYSLVVVASTRTMGEGSLHCCYREQLAYSLYGIFREPKLFRLAVRGDWDEIPNRCHSQSYRMKKRADKDILERVFGDSGFL